MRVASKKLRKEGLEGETPRNLKGGRTEAGNRGPCSEPQGRTRQTTGHTSSGRLRGRKTKKGGGGHRKGVIICGGRIQRKEEKIYTGP